jgi:hypothetical protein
MPFLGSNRIPRMEAVEETVLPRVEQSEPPVVGVELDVLDAPVGGYVLVLLAYGLAELLDLYLARLLRELLRGGPMALECVECVQEADGDCGRLT